nr:MAG TPA: hypothetical protein [Caudoviricetes sp.]
MEGVLFSTYSNELGLNNTNFNESIEKFVWK